MIIVRFMSPVQCLCSADVSKRDRTSEPCPLGKDTGMQVDGLEIWVLSIGRLLWLPAQYWLDAGPDHFSPLAEMVSSIRIFCVCGRGGITSHPQLSSLSHRALL